MGQGVSSATEGQLPLAISGEFEVVHVSVFMLVRTPASQSGWNTRHMATNELIRPLANPGGPTVEDDPESLYRDNHDLRLLDEVYCTYCGKYASAASTYPIDIIPWKKWQGKILGTDSSPVIWGPPFVDSIMLSTGPFMHNIYDDSFSARLTLSEKIKKLGFYKPTRYYFTIPTCSSRCASKALPDFKRFSSNQGLARSYLFLCSLSQQLWEILSVRSAGTKTSSYVRKTIDIAVLGKSEICHVAKLTVSVTAVESTRLWTGQGTKKFASFVGSVIQLRISTRNL